MSQINMKIIVIVSVASLMGQLGEAVDSNIMSSIDLALYLCSLYSLVTLNKYTIYVNCT